MKMYGVGYGQTTWHNRHFTNLEAADSFYQQEAREVEASFERQNCRPVVTEQPASADLLRSVVIQNTKKNGKPGAFRYKLHLYSFEKSICQWGCDACNSLRQLEAA